MQVSHAYSRDGRTTAWYTLNFVSLVSPRRSHTVSLSLPKAALALAILYDTSSSMLTEQDRVLPR